MIQQIKAVPLVCMVSAAAMLFPLAPAAQTVLTPKGTTVNLYNYIPELTQAEKDSYRAQYQELYPNAIYLSEATKTYNCHSFAWNVSEGGIYYWLNTPEDDKYWNDGSYIEQTTSPSNRGEKISYPYGDHSAIQTTVDNVFDSKWGKLPLWRHAWNYCPYDQPNYRTRFFAHYGRTVNNRTFGGASYAYDRRIASNSNLSVTNSTVLSGAKVDFAAGGTVTLGTGFIAQNGSSVRIRSWGTGLGKKIAESDIQGGDGGSTGGKKSSTPRVASVLPECNGFFASGNGSSGFQYQFDLAEPLPIGMAIFNCQGKLISKVNLGPRSAGRHRGSWTPAEKPAGMYIVRATIGGKIVSGKVISASR